MTWPLVVLILGLVWVVPAVAYIGVLSMRAKNAGRSMAELIAGQS